MRDWLLFFHILGAAAWIGGGLFSWLGFNAIIRSEAAGRGMEALGRAAGKYFGPAAGLTLISGALLVLTEDTWGWGDPFVTIGLGAFVFTALWQPLVASKVEKRVAAATAGEGDVGSALSAFNRSTVVEIGVLVFVVWAMVAKLGA